MIKVETCKTCGNAVQPNQTQARTWTPESTLGDIAEDLRAMKAGGMTRGALIYVVNRVWYDTEPQEEE